MTQMIQTAEYHAKFPPHGRPTKFTSEKIQQIRNLVERGKSREEIAELIGVTVGSLQVTCSRLGVSLRRPVFDNGTGLLRRRGLGANGTATHDPSSGNGGVLLRLTKEEPEYKSQVEPLEQAHAAMPHQERAIGTNEPASANLAVRMQYKGEQRSTDLPLTQDMIRQLAFEAEIRDMRIGELVGELIVAILKKDLLQAVLAAERTTIRAHRSRSEGKTRLLGIAVLQGERQARTTSKSLSALY